MAAGEGNRARSHRGSGGRGGASKLGGRLGPQVVVPRPCSAGQQYRTHGVDQERLELLNRGKKAGVAAQAAASARSYATDFDKATRRAWFYE